MREQMNNVVHAPEVATINAQEELRIHLNSTCGQHRVRHDIRMNATYSLSNADAAVNIAVRDIARASDFYGGLLGLTETGRQGEELVSYRSGSSLLFVYKSEYAGTNKATAMSWLVGGDVDAIAHALKAKGVAFEHYDLPGMQLEGDVHVGHDMRVAWFKDPDGNILSLVSG